MAFEKVIVKYDGEIREFLLENLDLANPDNPTDEQVKHALCQELGAANLNEYVVDRAETILNVRPAATYG